VLQSGKVVAVKRLYFGSRQWVDQFFNEVNLIIDINHKNLVKLLGCSITGPESLLVYEYVPNKTLHHYLSGMMNECATSVTYGYSCLQKKWSLQKLCLINMMKFMFMVNL